jgi:phosphoribosyl-ATP pyrophosphohydrolase/phosphoribosyl-AMP cyclohydrolase
MSLGATEIRFDDKGLVPAILQDSATGQVLMVAWMNDEALRLTRETGEAHFWSRSRQELWHKGATSGNTMAVVEIRVDCDGDTLLLKVEPAGPACHTGEDTCFYRRMGLHGAAAPKRSDSDSGDILHELFAVILDRKADPRPGSYTAHLLEAGEDEILKKTGEEAMEVILAAKGQGDERLVAEVGDLLYHLLVLLASRGLTLAEVEEELIRRRR